MKVDEPFQDLPTPTLDHFEVRGLQFADVSVFRRQSKKSLDELHSRCSVVVEHLPPPFFVLNPAHVDILSQSA